MKIRNIFRTEKIKKISTKSIISLIKHADYSFEPESRFGIQIK